MKSFLNKDQIINNFKKSQMLYEQRKKEKNLKLKRTLKENRYSNVYDEALDAEINKDEIIKDIKDYIRKKRLEDRASLTERKQTKKRKPKIANLLKKGDKFLTKSPVKSKSVILKESQLNDLLNKFEEEFYTDSDEDFEDFEKY